MTCLVQSPAETVISEPQRLDLDHIGQSANSVEHFRRQWLVDFDESDGVLPWRGAAEGEGCDIALGSTECVAQRADKARLVVIAHEQHRAAELSLERYALHRHDARLIAGEQGSSD